MLKKTCTKGTVYSLSSGLLEKKQLERRIEMLVIKPGKSLFKTCTVLICITLLSVGVLVEPPSLAETGATSDIIKSETNATTFQLGSPLDNIIITMPFGMRKHPILNEEKLHTGIDLSGQTGDSVYATQSGTVIYADWYGGYGSTIMIDHGDGFVSLYGHCSKLLRKQGDEVETGNLIAELGDTGNTTGPNLHFELRVDDTQVDPLDYMDVELEK